MAVPAWPMAGDRRLVAPPGEGTAARVGVERAWLRPRPGPDAAPDTEVVYGEPLLVFTREVVRPDAIAEGAGVLEGEWAQVQSLADGYVGWLPAPALAAAGPPATHRVATLRTFGYRAPGIKTPDPLALHHGARLAVVAAEGRFLRTAEGLHVIADHLVPIGTAHPDPVAVGEAHLGAPYLWGGRTSLGLDCSALVQAVLVAGGLPAPRDSDMLAAFLMAAGEAVPSREALQRGDVLFWQGHTGVMADGRTLLHANGHHMLVAAEPVDDAIARIARESFGALTGMWRPRYPR